MGDSVADIIIVDRQHDLCSDPVGGEDFRAAGRFFDDGHGSM